MIAGMIFKSVVFSSHYTTCPVTKTAPPDPLLPVSTAKLINLNVYLQRLRIMVSRSPIVVSLERAAKLCQKRQITNSNEKSALSFPPLVLPLSDPPLTPSSSDITGPSDNLTTNSNHRLHNILLITTSADIVPRMKTHASKNGDRQIASITVSEFP